MMMKESKDEFTTSWKRENAAGTVPNGVFRDQTKVLSLLQGLRLCQEAWAPKSPWDLHGAHAALWGRPAGSFLVVQGSSSQDQLLCVSVGDSGEPVKEFPIITSGAALQLTASHLAFPDLFQLLHFYTLSRDVLPVCLLVPSWVYTFNHLPDRLVPLLGPKAWLCPSSDLQTNSMTSETRDPAEMPETVLCTIQVTAASGALCFINPLYLQEHGDDWLTQSSASPINRSISLRRDKRLSTTRAWEGRGLKQRSSTLAEDNSSSFDHDRGSFEKSPASPSTPGGVVLRRASGTSKEDPLKRASIDSIQSPLPLPPHRVSWIEDKIWLNSPLPSSLLQPPCLELDSLSVSSIEEESEPALSPSPSLPSPRFQLADKMKNRLSAVGQALGGLVSPQRRLCKRVQEMAERKGGAFADAVRGFIEQTLTSEAVTGTEMLQEVRSALTALREMLFDCPEIQSITDSFGDTSDFELDAMLELALHKVALKPVYAHLYVYLKTARRDDGTLQRLEANKSTLENRSLEELEGAAGAGVPDSSMMEKIQQRWTTMHEAYSPSKKVNTLLKVCKNIYHSMNANAKPGTVFGADDFLPCLTWVLLRSDLAILQVDTDYMMELLDPMQLQGEGGYYLTSLYAALFYISSFQPRLAKRQLSAEAHKSLSQWHRRRTLHGNQSRHSRNRRTIRRHGPADGSRRTLEQRNSLNESIESGMQEPLQGLEEELESVTEEEDGSAVPEQIRLPKTLDLTCSERVSWEEDK